MFCFLWVNFFLKYFDIQDLSSRIVALSQNGPRNICILSANGAISNVTLRQPATSGGAVNYEVRNLPTDYLFTPFP